MGINAAWCRAGLGIVFGSFCFVSQSGLLFPVLCPSRVDVLCYPTIRVWLVSRD